MSWRQQFSDTAASGFLAGITAGRWFRMLRDNSFRVTPSCFLRALVTTVPTPMNSVLKRFEDLRFDRQVRQTGVTAPLFILGHQRSGTTHLHNLLSQDSRFGAPTFYQVVYPHTFLTTESRNARAVGFFLPRKRSFDNVHQHIGMPQEDELATCSMSGFSPYMSWVFPERVKHYDRFLTFHNANEGERNRWKSDFYWFAQKLTVKHQRRLIFKSPPHTARIALLLEMFPDAKFVHIHRNPYTVFQSTVRLTDRGQKMTRLQPTTNVDWQERILSQYEEMHAAFFRDAKRIPDGDLATVGFDDLQRDPIGQLRQVYEALQLPSFSECERPVQSYVDSISDYKRNPFTDLPDGLRETIYARWQQTFELWGYPRH